PTLLGPRLRSPPFPYAPLFRSRLLGDAPRNTSPIPPEPSRATTRYGPIISGRSDCMGKGNPIVLGAAQSCHDPPGSDPLTSMGARPVRPNDALEGRRVRTGHPCRPHQAPPRWQPGWPPTAPY